MQKTLNLLSLLLLLSFTPLFLKAQWTKTNGLPGGSVNALLQYGDTVLADVGDELYFSSNHGQTWSTLTSLNNISFFRSTTDGHTIVAYRYDPNTGYRMVRSNDFGQNWQYIASADTMLFYETFLAYGYLYASDYHGLYRTNNDGATWEYTTSRQISNIQFDGQRITGSSYPHILQSSDGGFTWDTLLQVSGNVIDMLQHENHLFAFMQNAQKGCYASSDYGQTWQQYTGTAFDQYYDFIWHNGSIYGLKGDKILKSPNLGQTWTILPAPPNNDYPAFTGVSTGNAIIIGGFYISDLGSILRSTDDGDSWFGADFGIIAASGKLRSINNQLYAPSESGLYQLDADGINWTRQNLNFTPSQFGARGFTDYVASGDNLILSEGTNPQVSLDGGVTWYESFVSSSQWNEGIPTFETIGNKVLGIGNNFDFSVYYISDNNGLTFLPIESLYQQHQTSISLLDVDQGKVYALAYDKNIYRSDDGCNNWVLHTNQIPADPIGQWGIYGTRLIVRGNVMALIPDYYVKKMLYSKDAGQTWSLIDLVTAGFPFGDANFNDLLYIGNNLVAATKNGIFRSENDGTDWIDWNDGLLLHRSVTNLEVHDGFLWAATAGSGIWKRALSELGMKPVAGKVFFDENANAQQDPGEPNLNQVIVQSLGTNAYTSTRNDGTYDLLSNLAQEQLKVSPPKPYWLSTPAIQTVAVPSTGADFALSLDPAAKDLSVDLTNISVLRPGFQTDYLLHWRNNVPIAATNVLLTLTYPIDLLELLETIPVPTSQVGGTLTWELGDVAAGSLGNVLLRFKVPVSDSLGTKVCVNTTISPQVGDLAPNDNAAENCNTVVGSYDPNDKQAEPSDFLTPAQLDNNEPITYTIRFQNTGNYPATFVRIADTLLQNFDPSSFQFLSASHPCVWNLRGQGEVEFFFDNIQLPPITTDELGSHGFVKYSVRPRQNLPHGMPLRNTAYIFFDFNAPVITNTTETLAGLVKTSEVLGQHIELRLSPNPASQLVRAETGGEAGELTLQDATGRIVLSQSVSGSNTDFSVAGLPQGLYQVIFIGEKTMMRGSLVVQR